MIYEIYLNDSIVIIWDDSKIEKIVRYKKYRDGIYLAGEDETIGKLAPFAKKLFELIISKYKMNNNFQDNGYQQYEIPGINIYAIIKGYNKYEDGGDISEEIKSNYYSENYTNIINNISRRISELNGRSIFKELQNDDGRIYNNWYTTYPRRQDGDDYKFKTSLKINVINPDVRLIDIEWLSDERSGSDYVRKYRQNELKEIVELLNNNRVIALVGEHGIGKSMLAETVVADYLKENKADNRNTFLFWLDYAGEKTFSRFICKLNQKWDPNPGYNSVDNIIQALNEDPYYNEDECIIVIDNLNYSNDTFFVDMSNFIGKLNNNIRVIVTSTNDGAIKSVDNSLIYKVKSLCDETYELLWKEITKLDELGNEFDEFKIIIRKNTLLTVLVGSIISDYKDKWEEKLKEINKLLNNAQLEENNDFAINDTDNNPYYNQEKGDLFSYISALFNFDLELEEDEINLLECLALYPITGVSQEEFERLFGNNCRHIIERKLRPRHWINGGINESDTISNLKLHPVIRNYILKRKDVDKGVDLYNISSKKVFVLNVEKLISEIAEKNLYDLLPISELIYNICYYLSPLTKRLLDMPHEQLVAEEEQRLFDEDGTINLEMIRTDAGDIVDFDIMSEIMQIVYQYSTFVEDTYLHDFSRVFPVVASVLRFLKYKYNNQRENLTIRDLRWIQGCGYSYLHTNTDPVSELKRRELEVALNTLEFACKELENRKKLLESTDQYNSKDYIDCVKTYCMVHGNIAAYYIRLAGLEANENFFKYAYDEYVLSLEIRYELLNFLNNSEYWRNDENYNSIKDEIMLLIATAKENIGYSIMRMENPNYRKAINKYKEAYEIRKSIARKEDRLLGSYMKYAECFVLLVENDNEFINQDNNEELITLYFKAKKELIKAYCKGQVYSEKALEKMMKICYSISDENSSFLRRDEWIGSIEKMNNK